MRIIHNSRQQQYRDPFGAQPTDSFVRLALEISEPELPIDFVLMHYAYGIRDFSTGRVMMIKGKYADLTSSKSDHDHDHVYSMQIRTPDESCLLFYWFQIRLKDHSSIFVYADPNHPGQAAWGAMPPYYHADQDRGRYPFQITVYEADFKAPVWMAGKTIYQIFPDRFARHETFSYEGMLKANNVEERIYHHDWKEDVDIYGKPESGYLACDFFGGSLKGITEHLDQLEKFAVSVLYMNPIFQARSNHRYDTADYLKVDPILGNEDDFQELVEEAAKRGIGIILDGVFSHTGADSVYFNRYGRFDNLGAYEATIQKLPSPYFAWYNIWQTDKGPDYDSWWGFKELPAVNENDLSFREFILGTTGVLRTWLKRGAKGFRLDVSDELPDGFLRALRRCVKKHDEEAVVLGEVWEDASNKVSYGAYRDFLFGYTHDTVMGYPFREIVLHFMTARIDAELLCERLDTIKENYPPAAFACNMNLLSSHDVPRFITAVAGEPDQGDRLWQQHMKLSPEQRRFGESMLLLAYGLTLTYPGSPSIYYGDEKAMEGYRDPFNRRTFPWDQAETTLERYLSEIAKLRQRYPVLQNGDIEWLEAKGRILSYRRYFKDGLTLLGEAGKGPGEARITLNAGEIARAAAPKGKLLPARSLEIKIDGKTWSYHLA